MKRPIAIALSPNTDTEDVRLAWHLLFVRSVWKDRGVLQRAAEKIAERFPNHFVTLTSSGRQALFDVLRSYNIKKGDEVILQAFTCIAVPEPIIWTGATPVYADLPTGMQASQSRYSIDPQEVRKKITPHTKAIVLQHTFGIPGPVEEILAIAKEHNLVVIEDCAHALGAMFNGKPLGTFGDAAILSFGRDKCISSVFGGAVITRDKHRAHTLQAMQSSRALPPTGWVMQQLLHPILFSFILPTYFWYGMGKALLVAFQKLGLLSRAVAFEEREGKKPVHFEYAYSPALAMLLLEQLKKLDHISERRRVIASRYSKELRIPTPGIEATPSYLRFPMQVANRNELLLHAREKHMLLGDWYDAALVPAASNFWAFQYIPGSCPNAEAISREIINLPTYPSLTDTQVTSVIEYMNTYAIAGNHE